MEEIGRDVVDMNSNVGRLLEMAQAFGQIDLGVTIRRAYDTFCEQVVGMIIEWLLNLSRSRLGHRYSRNDSRGIAVSEKTGFVHKTFDASNGVESGWRNRESNSD